MMKKPNCKTSSSPFPSPTSVIPSPGLGINTDSRMISKAAPNNYMILASSKPKPPKIRIIHIFAPEIIKTDVANFRELVQRLTGKPTHRKNNNKKLPPATPTTPLPLPLMIEYDDGGDGGGRRYQEEEEARAAGQYSSGYSDENYSSNDDQNSSLLFGKGNGCGGFGFEFLGKESSSSSGGGRIVKEEEEENEMLWIHGGGEAGGGSYFGELDDGFIQELGEFPVLDQNHQQQQQQNYSHQYLNHLHGFGSEAS